MGLVAGAERGTEGEVGLWQRALQGDTGRQRGEGLGPETALGSWELLSRTAAVPGDYVMFGGLLCHGTGQLWEPPSGLCTPSCLSSPSSSSSLPLPQPLLLSVCPPDSLPQLSVPCCRHCFAASSSSNYFSLQDPLRARVWMGESEESEKKVWELNHLLFLQVVKPIEMNKGSHWLLVTIACAWIARTVILLSHPLLCCKHPSHILGTEEQQGLHQKPPIIYQVNNGLPWASQSSDSKLALARCERPHPSRGPWVIIHKQH